jgi:predicted ArsR family transcriptional regulator
MSIAGRGLVPEVERSDAVGPSWTFLTNHAHVLVCLAADADMRMRDVARLVGITERAAQRILHDLVTAGYVSRTRVGRRNSYRLRLEQPMRHPLESGHAVRALIAALAFDETERTMSGPIGLRSDHEAE